MSKARAIGSILHARPVTEGAGVRLHRVFGFGRDNPFDPFLLLDDFRGDDPSGYLKGLPWHPHRGIETITYVLKGHVEHGDSLGNSGKIAAGDVQWMTAGSGVIHQEMPEGDKAGVLEGFQLWANLPASHKMMPPRYREVKTEQIPEITLENGVRLRLIAGAWGESEESFVEGPVRDVVTRPHYLDITLPPHCTFDHPVRRGDTVLAYVIRGGGLFDTSQDTPFLKNRQLVHFGDGDSINVRTGEEPLRFLLFTGTPIGEPVAWYGPIVMNTEEELETAFAELEAGTFLRHPKNRRG